MQNAIAAVIDTSVLNPDTVVSAVYGLVWTDTYSANPIQNNILYSRPGETVVYTYEFINNANAPDTVYIELGNLNFTGITGSGWQTAIYNEDQSIKLGDTNCTITNLQAGAKYKVNVIITIGSAAANMSSGGCTIAIKTISAPVGSYSGDNSSEYGGRPLITDFDDSDSAYAIVRYPQISINSPANGNSTNLAVLNISGTTAYTQTGDTLQVFVNSILQNQIALTDVSNDWISQISLTNPTANTIAVFVMEQSGNIMAGDTIIINYSNIVGINFYYPTISAMVIDTSAQTLLIRGYSTAINEYVNIFVNNNLVDSVSVSIINRWESIIPLAAYADSKVLNVIEARMANPMIAQYFDTITVYCDLEKPNAVDSGLITKTIDASDNSKPIIYFRWQKPADDVNRYKIYRYNSGGLLTAQTTVYTETFIDTTTFYGVNYIYYIEPIDKSGNIGDSLPGKIEVSEITQLSNITQMLVSPKNNNGNYSVIINLLNHEAEILDCFDGNTIAIRANNINTIYFDAPYKTFVNGAAEFFVSGAIGITPQRVSLTFSGKTFETLLIFKLDDSDTLPPIIYSSESGDSSFAIAAIPYYTYSYLKNIDTGVTLVIKEENEFLADLTAKKNEANAALEAAGEYMTFNTLTGNRLSTIKSFELIKESGEKIRTFGDNYIHLFISYPDNNNDSVVDGTETLSTSGVVAGNISFMHLNETINRWELLPFIKVDGLNKVVSTKLNHFSVFMTAGKSYSLSDIITNLKVYPNPFKPNSDPSHTQIIFDNVNPGLRLRIFTITGQLVHEATAPANQYRLIWDGRNQRGKSVASGVYIYLAEYRIFKSTGKLLIIK